MKPSERPSSSASYLGHVKNGVVVPDAQIPLSEGQAVRIEPLAPAEESPLRDERTEQLRRMQNLFAQWDEEDKEVSDEDAESFHKALEQNRGLNFRTPKLD